MKRHAVIGIAAVLFILLLSLFSCSDSENRNLALLNQAKVIIDLGMPEEVVSTGMLDHILRFFTRDAIARTAPAAFGLIKVRVTGPDIGVIERDFAPYDTISMNVPAGSLRWFEVTAYVAPGDPSAAFSFRGTAAANLPAGQTVSVPVVMGLNETKIVIPDGGNWFSSTVAGLIMMNDVNPTSWIHKTAADYTGLTNLRPLDIDYDARGRIYVASNSSPAVIRMDDINGTNLIQSSATIFGTGTALTSTCTIAVDRINKRVYFAVAGSAVVYQSNLDGTSTIALPAITAITNITGIDVDSEGMLYIVGYTNTIIRYNPVTHAIIAGPYTTSLSTPNDVRVRTPYVYIANRGAASGVLKLSINNNVFSFVAQYGTLIGTQNNLPPNFYGAYRFLAIRNDLIIADSQTMYSKLISISPDPLGANWIGYGVKGATTNTPGIFYLFSSC